MSNDDEVAMEILFSRIGYALLGLSRNDRLFIVSYLEQLAGQLIENYVDVNETCRHKVAKKQNIG